MMPHDSPMLPRLGLRRNQIPLLIQQWRPLQINFPRNHQTRAAAHLDALVEEYEPYALSLAHRMHRNREPLEDLEQIAREALISALNRFDPERGLPLTSVSRSRRPGSLAW